MKLRDLNYILGHFSDYTVSMSVTTSLSTLTMRPSFFEVIVAKFHNQLCKTLLQTIIYCFLNKRSRRDRVWHQHETFQQNWHVLWRHIIAFPTPFMVLYNHLVPRITYTENNVCTCSNGETRAVERAQIFSIVSNDFFVLDIQVLCF